jgi:hypothetical protein
MPNTKIKFKEIKNEMGYPLQILKNLRFRS